MHNSTHNRFASIRKFTTSYWFGIVVYLQHGGDACIYRQKKRHCHPIYCCLDIDECALIADVCRHGYCVNNIGSFRCDCFAGYRYTPALYICEGIAPVFFHSFVHFIHSRSNKVHLDSCPQIVLTYEWQLNQMWLEKFTHLIVRLKTASELKSKFFTEAGSNIASADAMSM